MPDTDGRESPIILALDVPNAQEALAWVERLSGRINIFKVGMQLFYKEGPRIVEQINARRASVFLDLKLHDIPNTVESACRSLAALAPRFLTVHASGGLEMLERAQAVFNGSSTQLLGVTALTSLDDSALHAVYPGQNPLSTSDWAIHLAGLVQQAGLAGVVCSPQETKTVRARYGEKICIVTPGIRPEQTALGDQKRVMTPAQAIASGSDYLVIGRPLLSAANPLGMADKIIESIKEATCNAPGLPA